MRQLIRQCGERLAGLRRAVARVNRQAGSALRERGGRDVDLES